MANAKLQLEIGNMKMTCEGEDTWIGAQLDKILSRMAGPHSVNLESSLQQAKDIKISVANCDVADQPCDVLILKHAQGFHGADLNVSQLLV